MAHSVVSSGQTASGVTIFSGHTGEIDGYGTLEASIVQAGGTLFLSANALGSGLRLEGTVSNGGLVENSLITNGGTMKDTNVQGSPVLASYDNTINSGGEELLFGFFPMEALDTQIGFGGKQLVTFGNSIDAQVFNGGLQQGYRASGTTVHSGGAIEIYGSATGVVVQGGGEAIVTDGGALAGTLSSGSFLVVSYTSGAAGSIDDLTGLTAESGATVVMFEGARETGLVVDSGAIVETVAVENFNLNGAAVRLVAAANTVSGGLISSGGAQQIGSGGTAVGATILGGGVQYIYSGGVASNTTLRGGHGYVLTGGIASNAAIGGGGIEFVVSGGVALNTTVVAGGELFASAGIVSDTTVQSGGLAFISGYYVTEARDTQVQFGGVEEIWYGATTDRTVVSAGGVEASIYGIASNTTVQAGGTLFLDGSGGAVGGTILSGGHFIVTPSDYSSNAFISNSIAESGAKVLLIGGVAVPGLTIDTGAIVSSAGIAVFSEATNTVSAPFLLQVANPLSGGAIGIRTTEDVGMGGTVISTTIQGGGRQDVSNGGRAFATIVQSGAYQTVFDAGSGTTLAQNSVISSGGELSVSQGGIASGATIEGQADIYNGGILIDATIASQGAAFLQYSGSIASGGTIENGGDLFVERGGFDSGTAIAAGGQLVVSSGGTATALSIAVGGTLTLDNIKYSASGSVTLSPHDVLTVHGSHQIEQIQLVGNYAGEQFYQAPAFNGGIYILLSATSAASAAVIAGGELLVPTAAPDPQPGVLSRPQTAPIDPQPAAHPSFDLPPVHPFTP